MPQAIVYCDRCGKLIRPGDVARADGIFTDKGSICAACAQTLTPEQRAVIQGEAPPAAAPRAAGPGSGRQPAVRRGPGGGPGVPRAPTRRYRVDDVTERGPAQGGKSSQGILIAGIAAGVLAGLAATLLLVSGGKRPQRPPAPAAGDTGTGGAGPGAEPPAVEPPKPIVSREVVAAAAHRLAGIRAMHDPSLGRYGKMRRALVAFPEEYAGTPAADEAARFLEKLDAEYAEFAEIALAVAIDAARQLTCEGRHAEAESELRSVGERYPLGPWFEERGRPTVDDALAGIRKEIEDIATSALANARDLAQAGDVRGARAALASSGVWPADLRERAREFLAEAAAKGAAGDGYVAGLTGEYFDGIDPASRRARLRRVDAQPFFDWGDGSPSPEVPSDRFSARWTGEMMAPVDGRYHFRVHHDDSAALTIDGKTIVEFRGEKVGTIEGTAELRAGWRAVRIDFEEYAGGALIKIEWAGPGFAWSPVAGDVLRTKAGEANAPAPAGTTGLAQAAPASAPATAPAPVAGDDAAWTKARVFETAIAKADFDQGSPGDWVCWTKDSGPGHSGWKFGETPEPGPRHARMGFKRSVVVGSILTTAKPGVRVSVLKADAAYPGDVADDSQWIAGWRPSEREVSLWLFPAGTRTRAVRFSYTSPADAKSHEGHVGGLVILPDGFTDAAAEAAPSTSSRPERARVLNDGGYNTWDPWDNGKEGGAEVVSAASPETVTLVWPEAVPLRGICPLRAGFRRADVLVFTGAEDADPAAALDEDWRKVGPFDANDQYPRTLGTNWMDFGGVVKTRAVRLVITQPQPDQSVHPHMEWHAKGGKRVWLGELLALRPVGGGALSGLVERLATVRGRTKADPATDGYYLTPGVLLSLAKAREGKDVKPRTLAAVGGAVAASSYFDAKKTLEPKDGYVFLGKSGVAGGRVSAASVGKALARTLERERPELVRVCFGARDLAKGRPARDVVADVEALVKQCLEAGAAPVLFTIPMIAPPDENARGLVEGYNRAVLALAVRTTVPCVDAYGILNRDPGLAGKYFRRGGQLTKEAHEAMDAAFVALYRVLEQAAFGRAAGGADGGEGDGVVTEG